MGKEERLNKRGLYKRYWKCRDFELTTLWQRAVFLGPILVMIFTGYGTFFAKCFIDDNKVKILESGFSENHLVAVVIAVMGMLFSILWIRMMKGSKAWYEVYERAITAMDTQKDWIYDKELLECGAGFKHHRLPGYKRVGRTDTPQFCDCLFSTKGGCFSPSKINIVIGQISLLFWLFVAIFHLFSCTAILANDPVIAAVVVLIMELLAILHIIYEVFKPQCKEAEPGCFFQKKSVLGDCRSNSLRERDPGIYTKENLEKRIYTLRIVDYEKKIEEVIKYPETVKIWASVDIEEKVRAVSLRIVLDKDFERWADYPCYASVNFKTWCERRGLIPSSDVVRNFLKEEIKPVFDSFRWEAS